MGKLTTRFADWVDSKGEGAGDHMVAGMILGAMVAGMFGLVLGLAFGVDVLVLVGFLVALGHLGYAMAVL